MRAHTHARMYAHLQLRNDAVRNVLLLLLKEVETDRVEGVGPKLGVTEEDLGRRK